MFTGIIQSVGKIISLTANGKGARLTIQTRFNKQAKKGDSLSIDGVCLTVIRKSGQQLSFDLSAETLERTNFACRTGGQKVNVELPITAETMLSGHLVQGHVDGVGHVKRWIRALEDVRLFIDVPQELVDYCVPKGSIAINGVSLTIASLRDRVIGIALIPYTLEHTNLNDLQPGDLVNIETDLIGRYVVSALKRTYDKR
jgi:riboflavin synthase